MDVTDIGRKSATEAGVLGTGVTSECFHAVGTHPVLIEKLISAAITSLKRLAQSLKIQCGMPSGPVLVFRPKSDAIKR